MGQGRMKLVVDTDYLRAHYRAMNDDELSRLAGEDLVAEARALLEKELTARGIPVSAPRAPSADRDKLEWRAPRHPYDPPNAALADAMAEEAVLKVSGLLRLFQGMVITSTFLGLLLAFWPYLPIPLSDDALAAKSVGGSGALAPAIVEAVFYLSQPIWVISAIGLCFLRWWGRTLLAGAYLVTSLAYLLGGVAIFLPLELLISTLVGLLDGAVLALAYLPPLSKHFARGKG